VNLDRIGAYVYGWVGVEKPNPAGGWIRVVGHATAQMQQTLADFVVRSEPRSRGSGRRERPSREEVEN
jgi:hypothetical protein